jgi:hypothetical protein
LVLELGAVEKFYRQFAARTRIGMKATGNCHWFVDLLTAVKAVLQRRGDVLLDSNRAAPNYKINVKT